MIKLLAPFNYGGQVIDAGTTRGFPPEVEKALIDAGNAERVSKSPVEPPAEPTDQTPEAKPDSKPSGRRGNR